MPLVRFLFDSAAPANLIAPGSSAAADSYTDSDAAATALLADSDVATVSRAGSGVIDANRCTDLDAVATSDSLTN